MATLRVVGSMLEVQLSTLERLGACVMHDPTVPLAAIQSVRVSDQPWSELRGIRAPGTGLPKVVMLGTRRYRGGKDFAAVYRSDPAVVVELAGAAYGRIVVSAGDPASVVAEIERARLAWPGLAWPGLDE